MTGSLGNELLGNETQEADSCINKHRYRRSGSICLRSLGSQSMVGISCTLTSY